MAEVVRRTISELATLYTLEPSLRDVYVEGPSDCVLLKWYLSRRCGENVSVLDVDAIEVASDMVAKWGYENGNRGRVLALANEIVELLGPDVHCITVVYDTDFDSLSNDCVKPRCAICTDFSSLEMYLFDSGVVGKFASLVLQNPEMDIEIAMVSLSKVLVRLWTIKAANHFLRFGMTWISCENVCSVAGSEIHFDEDEYVKRYLMNNARLSDLTEFKDKISELSGQLQEDPRHHMNGHHFMHLARWYFRSFAAEKAALNNERAFERAFFGCIELQALDEFPLFQQLVRRCSE